LVYPCDLRNLIAWFIRYFPMPFPLCSSKTKVS
jgi:hypothetical protein